MFLEMKFMLQPDLDFGLEQTDCEYLLSSLSLVDQGFVGVSFVAPSSILMRL